MQELGRAKEAIKRLTIGAQKLDKILEEGKLYGDKRGLGYIDECSTPSSSKTIFIKAFPIMSKSKSNTCKFVSKYDKSRFVSVCHYCGVEGHIRPKCFKLKNSQNIHLGRKVYQNTKFNNALKNNFTNLVEQINSCIMLFVSRVVSLDIKIILVTYPNTMSSNMKWNPKFVKTNFIGLKQVWVPKGQS